MIIQADKEKILEEFLEKYVVDRWVNKFLEIDEMYKSDKDDIEKNLISAFDEVCRKAICLQGKQLKGEIKYIYFSLLRTSILENRGEYRVDLYDEDWFLDKEECSINIDLNFIFDSIFKQREELKEKKKVYGKNITDMDIENVMLKEIDKYHILAVEFLKGMIGKFIETSSYGEMKKTEDIMILAGEYMDATEAIYPEKE
ncbi:hypothetical protein [Clostridium aciditolerans]|uniref:Uncharacterized protein n=1 Tax=Clostridium aciditolerans TaxID=339861 RepID=A0A934M1R1_9CLOT|nr:hypothetical protein [Clostridium aciditolerans]MBI6871347.1 hypothetical protein [Clostridium aciditolerans]